MNRLTLLVVIVAVFGLASCHSASTTTAVTCTTTTATTSSTSSSVSCTDSATNITVTLSPSTVSVNVVTPIQFYGSATGGTDTIITWKVNNIAGGNSTIGTIDSTGLYRAPANPPSPPTVTVSATSFEDQNVSATSAVTITPPPVVTISPTTASIQSGTANRQVFTSTVTGAATTNVDWYVSAPGTNAILGGNDVIGTVDGNGVYTAPRTPPVGSSVSVIAVSRDFNLSSATATVVISGYTTSSLNGQFAFSMSGQNASHPFYRAGSFSADGLGNLSGGLEDINDSAAGLNSSNSFVGTYTVTLDGRGTLTFADGATSSKFDFVLVNGKQLQIFGYDAGFTASGQANMQDLSAFNTTAIRGTYVLDFRGVHGSNGFSEVGEFAADGAGNITTGELDIEDGGVATSEIPISGGTYVVDSNTGRGTASITAGGATSSFSFYMVSRGSAKFVGTDITTSPRIAGAVSQQTPNVNFNIASLNGNFAFLLSNSASASTFTSAGTILADGAGHIASGAMDENFSGTANANLATSGSYLMKGANGRGIVALTGGRTYVFYLSAPGSGVFQETDAIRPVASDGILALQQNAAFSQSLFSGNYAIASAGLFGSSIETLSGEVALGSGAGIIDINTGGTLTTGQTLTATLGLPSGSERGTLTLALQNPLTQSRQFAVYVINSVGALPTQQIILIEVDTGLAPVPVSGGSLFQQF